MSFVEDYPQYKEQGFFCGEGYKVLIFPLIKILHEVVVSDLRLLYLFEF